MAAPDNTARRQFLRFALIGAAGFVADTSVLYIAMHFLGTGPYLGRALSYLGAASFTWAMNRRYTFFAYRDSNHFREWLKFLAANAIGGGLNYAVYAALVSISDVVAAWPVLGVAAGSVAGLVVNFALSRKMVFNKAES